MSQGKWAWLLVLLGLGTHLHTQAQIDPEKRRLIQVGYNQPVQGRAPIAAYGFLYYNQPGFLATNLTLRLSVAPIYLDSELGFSQFIGPNTDLGIGLAGGGFADSYSEIREGRFRRRESFEGHGGEVSSSVYHLFNPGHMVPLYLVARAGAHQSLYNRSDDTDRNFELPDDRTSIFWRTGLRFGGQEPSLTEPWAMELSLWYEGRHRIDDDAYGYLDDREVQSLTHHFWTRALWKYGSDRTEHLFEASITAGASVNPDRFSAFRLGGNLPFASEFPLSIPGYFFQELSAEHAVLFNADYSLPLPPFKSLRLDLQAATALVDYLPGMEQSGTWHSGVGGGLSYISPSGSWIVKVMYGHAFDALRNGRRGADNVALLFQYDFDAKSQGKSRFFIPGMNPYRSRAAEQLFR